MRRILVMAVVVAVVATGCYSAYDFNGDTKADRVWWSADGHWYRDDVQVFTGGTNAAVPTSIGTEVGITWGVPVVGNYDGAGGDDLAVIGRAIDGWSSDWVTHGAAGTITFAPPPLVLGASADYYPQVPVPGQWNGGATTIPAWFRDVDGMWFIQGHDPVQFGSGPSGPINNGGGGYAAVDQDMPVPADYDGDGTTDLAVYNPRTGIWRTRGSKTGTETTTTLGGTGWLPAPGDYDGVHHSQFAVFNALNTAAEPPGTWHVDGHDPVTPLYLGPTLAPDTGLTVPVPADYDGDGKTDLASITNVGSSNATNIWRIEPSGPGRPPFPAEPIFVRLPAGPLVLPAEVLPSVLVAMPRLQLIHQDVCQANPSLPATC